MIYNDIFNVQKSRGSKTLPRGQDPILTIIEARRELRACTIMKSSFKEHSALHNGLKGYHGINYRRNTQNSPVSIHSMHQKEYNKRGTMALITMA